ncbi:cytochrome P450 [Actinospica durhamensis]|uniref:Cytochrome P450 n=1 Tax=Actinospica durhamensis TaxID=1508375 RepID=A0A941ELV4_9ACTN|nr:cytochrome P450 [Actinospica durhamensis]MBR7832743.1 cytochrome P450 [Actinospica durhamensis]
MTDHTTLSAAECGAPEEQVDVPAPLLPGAWPLLGHAPALLRDPLALLVRAGRAAPLTRVRLGPAAAYVVTGPDLVHQVLVTDAAGYDKGFQFDVLRRLIGDGVGTSRGAKHRRNKRMLRPAFDRTASRGHAVDMTPQIEHFLGAQWDPASAPRGHAAPDGARTVDAAVDMRVLSMRLITRSMSGSEFAADEVMRALPGLLSGIGRRALLPIRALDLVPTPGNRRFDHSLRRVHAVADDMVARERARAARQGSPGSAGLLAALLAAVDEEGAGMTDAQAHDEIMTLLLAGTETTAGVLAWCLHVLARDSELQQRLRLEIAEVTGGKRLEPADLRGLELAERVVKEVLRLYPPGWLVGRRAVQETRLGATRIPAGSQVLVNFYALQRDPGAFPDPDAFDPDRWKSMDMAAAGPYYLPFGSGPRVCLGESYGMAEIFCTLCAILAGYRIEPVPGTVVRPVARTTLHPDTVPLRVTRISGP